MTYIMVDVEADGPIPGDYSMVCFGAIVVEPSLDRTFYGRAKPISDSWIPEALQVSGFAREETLQFDHPKAVMQQFANWIAEVGGGHSSTKSRFSLQGRSQGHVRQFQTLEKDEAHPSSGGRCSGQCRSVVADQGRARAEDQLQVIVSLTEQTTSRPEWPSCTHPRRGRRKPQPTLHCAA